MNSKASNGSKIRLAIVDDLPELVGILSKVIDTDPGIEIVAIGADGLDAIRIHDEFQPDVLIMCVLMPNMDGITATRRIRAEHPGAKIIILTATSPEQSRDRALEAGAAAYISKPVSASELLETIHNVANED